MLVVLVAAVVHSLSVLADRLPQAGVGKSSLINRVFGIREAVSCYIHPFSPGARWLALT